MAEKEAKIKISGDNKEFKKAIGQIKKESKDLEAGLGKIAKSSGLVFAGLIGTIGLTVAAFRRQEQALFRQEATLNATGFAAGLTAKELQKMAAGLQDITTFGDEAIIEGQNILLTFREIGKETFPRATKTALDLSTAMGIDLKNANIQVGKALNDPITGLTMLTRVGITFTDEQKALIRSLQETGDLAGAQAVILSELENQFGGAAEAAAQGTGAFIQLGNVFGDFLEDIGKQFVPILAEAANALKGFFKFLIETPGVAKFIARLLAAGAVVSGFVLALAIAGIGLSKFNTALKIVAVTMGTTRLAVALLAGALTLGIGLIIAFLPEIIAFGKTIIAIFPKVLKAVKNATDEILDAFIGLGKDLLKVGRDIGIFLISLFTFSPSAIKAAAKRLKDTVAAAAASAFEGIGAVTQKVKLGLINEGAIQSAAQADIEATKKAEEEKAAIRKAAAAKRERLEIAQIKRVNAERLKEFRALASQPFNVAFGIQTETVDGKTAEEAQREGAAIDLGRVAEGGIAIGTSILRGMAQGTEGARQLLADLAQSAAIAAFGPAGEVAGELFKILSKSPEELRKQVNEFFTAIPMLLENVIVNAFKTLPEVVIANISPLLASLLLLVAESITLIFAQIPEILTQLFIEELPRIIDALIEGIPAIVQALADALGPFGKKLGELAPLIILSIVENVPRLIIALTDQMPAVALALAIASVELQPIIAASFAEALIAQAPAIGRAIINAVKGQATGRIAGGGAASVLSGLFGKHGGMIQGAQAGGSPMKLRGLGSGDKIPMLGEPGEIFIPKPIAPTFQEQFGNLKGQGTSVTKTTTINVPVENFIGEEEFVNNTIIPKIREAVLFDNADLGIDEADVEQ